MKRSIAVILAIALTAGPALGVVAAEKPEAITVAYFAEWPTANQVAQAERWYDEEMGLELKWRTYDSGVEMADAMVAGEVDISYAMGVIPFMGAVSKGAPLTTVGIAVSYAENDNCVVHRKAAIDKANAHELEGKKIAVPFGTVTHYKLLRTLDFPRRRYQQAEPHRHGFRQGRRGAGPWRGDHGLRLWRRAQTHAGQEPRPDERPGADEDRHSDI